MYVRELQLNEERKQQLPIGTPLFPCMCYDQYMDQLVGGHVPWHWQEELEYLIITEGGAWMDCQGKKILIRKGEGVFINSGILHRLKQRGEERCRYYSILFHPELLYGVPQSIVDQKYVRPILECRELAFVKFDRETLWMQKVLDYVGRAITAFHDQEFGYEILVRENFSMAWYHFARNCRALIGNSRQGADEKEQRLKAMVKYIYDHYEESLTVVRIAGAVGISESECYRCFRRKLGVSPADFLLNHRIRTAAGMLRDTGESITDISYRVGFNNPSYFAKCFRNVLGCSPREYRKRREKVS